MIFKFSFIFGMLVTALAQADSTITKSQQHIAPESIDGATVISAIQVVNKISDNNSIVLIDSRYPADRKQGYIQGSIPLPDTSTNCTSLAQHIPSKTHPVIFYCNGIRCKRSEAAIKIAKPCGYSHIYWFRGGYDEWLINEFPYAKE